MADSRFDNVKYLCWLKICMALLYAKEGLEKLIDKRTNQFHDRIKEKLGDRVCESCSKNDLKKQWGSYDLKCNLNVCNVWLEALRSYLPSGRTTLEWDNTIISSLPKSAWECTKLFMPFGCEAVTQARHADIAAILTLFVNNQFFMDLIGKNNSSLVKKVKDIRNKIMHSGTLELEEDEMKNDIDSIIDLLQCHSNLAENKECKDAITRIRELQNCVPEISKHIKENEIQLLKDRMKETEKKVDKACHSYDEFNEEMKERKKIETDTCADVATIKTNYRVLHKNFEEVKEEIDHVVSFLSKFIEANGIEGVGLKQLIERADKLNIFIREVDTMRTDISSLEHRFNMSEEKANQQGVKLDQQHERQNQQGKIINQLKRNQDDWLQSSDRSKKTKMTDFEQRKKEYSLDSDQRAPVGAFSFEITPYTTYDLPS